MTSQLNWEPIVRKHCRLFHSFVATRPPKPIKSAATGWKPFHPRQWEYDAQQIARRVGSEVPPARGVTTLVGLDEHGDLGGVMRWEELDGPGLVHLDVLALSVHVRSPSGTPPELREGTFAMKHALSEIERRAIEAGCEAMYVEGEVFRLNAASLAMVRHFKFKFDEEAPTGAQTWSLSYRFPPGVNR